MFLIKERFYDTLTQKNRILPYYSKLINSLNNETLYESNNQKTDKHKKTVSISLFPSFLDFNLKNEGLFALKQIPQEKIIGYAILTQNHKNIESFLKQEYKKNFRANIKRVLNRLEICFDIEYEMYFGSITKEKYYVLMTELKQMLTKRFKQRGDSTHVLNDWEAYYNSIFNLINKKKASVFVIYANKKIIHICVNHHLNNIIFISIPSYNINYHKFALGNISIYKLLEWGINNKYNMFDMAYGNLEYKRRWSNYIYSFKHHIIFDKKNLKQLIISHFEALIIHTKNILKKYDIDKYIEKFKNKANKETKYIELPNHIIETEFDFDIIFFSEINILKNEILEILVCNFLYSSKENIKNIKLMKNENNKEILILGETAKCKIIFDKYLDLNI
ncbi:GNAT family N-acetyltransferase [Thalassobellus suaedae]|uniref:GNAT family N-acetyltransferase n=2 Tax=Thalassobellus suaedae TaxID=3074124 RepID=A0ABY9Y2P3_9FLAO|nr:GNAT family N-acetyltransferase [Flavobacteriaceae bacterium HL-DH10]